MTKASSCSPVECQPTDSPGFSFTDPPRIPLVCGTPLRSGQSPPEHASENVAGAGLDRVLWAHRTMLSNDDIARMAHTLAFIIAPLVSFALV